MLLPSSSSLLSQIPRDVVDWREMHRREDARSGSPRRFVGFFVWIEAALDETICKGREGKGRVLLLRGTCYLFLLLFFTLKLRAWCLGIYLFIQAAFCFTFPGFVSILFKRVLGSLFLFIFLSFPFLQVRALSPFCHLLFPSLLVLRILLRLILCFLECSIVQAARIVY
ncbi:hypothetical protein V8C34DRAFT_130680 [Trichoderma compactum]